MSDEKPKCYGCDKTIEGTVVWFRPFGKLVWEGPKVAQLVAQASPEKMENSRPFHPECFEKWTGQKWPPDK
jgi:hypothetical protein